jgi:hypothetical protein
MDRQLEAPDEFAALQTHRVNLAVARRQLAFVERMVQVMLSAEVHSSTCKLHPNSFWEACSAGSGLHMHCS